MEGFSPRGILQGMRFRLTTLLTATLTAALLMWANFHERQAAVKRWQHEALDVTIHTTSGSAYGWPAVVYKESYLEDGRRIYRQRWAIAVNLAFGLAAVGIVAYLVERLERRRARQNQERLKA